MHGNYYKYCSRLKNVFLQRFVFNSSNEIFFFISFQTIYDSGTYEELCQRQSITTECIFGEEEEETDFDDSPSPLVPTQASNPSPIVVPVVAHKNENNIQCKRAKFVRKQSVMQYMQDQQSIDDDPVTSLYTVNIIFSFG